MTEAKVSVVIPAHNEAAAIASLVERVRLVDPSFEIIVVDDGSEDDTGQRAAAAGARVLRNPYNIGNGASIKRGAREAVGDILVFMDGDGQHPPEAIPYLLAQMDKFHMAVAARTNLYEGSLIRRLGNWALTRMAQLVTKQPIADLTSGFRAVHRKKFIQFLPLYPNRYSYPTTSTIAFMNSAYFVTYVPVAAIGQRASGASGISPLADGLRFLYIILRMLMLFSPGYIFLPAALLLGLAGLGFAFYQYLLTSGLHGTSIILLTLGGITFLIGLVAEQIATLRLDRRED